MEKRDSLINKVKGLLDKTNVPEWLHHFGPKKFKFFDHFLALLIKKACQLSFRRTSKLLKSLGFKVPSYSALCKMRLRLPKKLWDAFLHQTIPQRPVRVAAIDGTTLTRTNPSWHYTQRIGRKSPIKQPLKLSALVETAGKKRILALRVRAKNSHDVKDVRYLLKSSPSKMNILVADKGYDAEWIHELVFDMNMTSMIPTRKNSKKGFFRKKMKKQFRQRTYHRREMVERVFSALKQKYGQCVKAKSWKTQTAEVYCAAILHNLDLRY